MNVPSLKLNHGKEKVTALDASEELFTVSLNAAETVGVS